MGCPEQGDGSAMNDLGVLYENGWGVQLDYNEARRWYEQSIDAGNRFGAFNAAQMYEQGLGVTADRARATELYKDAARLEHRGAQDWLPERGVPWR